MIISYCLIETATGYKALCTAFATLVWKHLVGELKVCRVYYLTEEKLVKEAEHTFKLNFARK